MSRLGVSIDMSNCSLRDNGDMEVAPPHDYLMTPLNTAANAAFHQAQFELAGEQAIHPQGNSEPPGQEQWTLHNTWECDAYGAQLVASNRIDTKVAKRGMSSIVLHADDPQFHNVVARTSQVAHRLLKTIKEWQELADEKAKRFVNIHHEFVVRPGLVDNLDSNFGWKTMFKFAPGDRIRNIMKHRMFPVLVVKSIPTEEQVIDLREKRAQQTLRKIIGERAYWQFRRRGFVSVRGASGKTYVLFPGNKHSQVYENGEHIHDICVILKEPYAPTDSLIMRLVMILSDEEKFRSMANVHGVVKSLWPVDLMEKCSEAMRGNNKSLPQIYRELKERAIWEPKVFAEWAKRPMSIAEGYPRRTEQMIDELRTQEG